MRSISGSLYTSIWSNIFRPPIRFSMEVQFWLYLLFSILRCYITSSNSGFSAILVSPALWRNPIVNLLDIKMGVLVNIIYVFISQLNAWILLEKSSVVSFAIVCLVFWPVQWVLQYQLGMAVLLVLTSFSSCFSTRRLLDISFFCNVLIRLRHFDCLT